MFVFFFFFLFEMCINLGKKKQTENIEYVLASQEDGVVAYRIVAIPPEDDTKSTIAHVNNNTTAMPQQLQYIVIDNVNGYLQAMPTQTSIAVSTTASSSINSTSSLVSVPINTSRPSVTIAPKIAKTDATSKYINTLSTSTAKKQTVCILVVFNARAIFGFRFSFIFLQIDDVG